MGLVGRLEWTANMIVDVTFLGGHLSPKQYQGVKDTKVIKGTLLIHFYDERFLPVVIKLERTNEVKITND